MLNLTIHGLCIYEYRDKFRGGGHQAFTSVFAYIFTFTATGFFNCFQSHIFHVPSLSCYISLFSFSLQHTIQIYFCQMFHQFKSHQSITMPSTQISNLTRLDYTSIQRIRILDFYFNLILTCFSFYLYFYFFMTIIF